MDLMFCSFPLLKHLTYSRQSRRPGSVGRRFAHQRFADSHESIRKKYLFSKHLARFARITSSLRFALKFARFASNPRCYPIFGRSIRKTKRFFRSENRFARIGPLSALQWISKLPRSQKFSLKLPLFLQDLYRTQDPQCLDSPRCVTLEDSEMSPRSSHRASGHGEPQKESENSASDPLSLSLSLSLLSLSLSLSLLSLSLSTSLSMSFSLSFSLSFSPSLSLSVSLSLSLSLSVSLSLSLSLSLYVSPSSPSIP